jgi:hypothetical protein
MSFGYSIGDAVMLLQLARRTYRYCKEAGGEYLEIAREVKSLYSVLKTVRGEVEKPGQVLFQPGSRTAVEIIALTDGCKVVLDEVGVLLAEHKGLAPEGEDMGAGKKLWHRLKFGNKIEELGKVRQKIITYTSTIAVLLDTIHLKITGRVENKVEAGFAEMLDRFEGMRKTILDIAAKTRAAQRSGSVTSVRSALSLSTYMDDDKEVWRRFRTELIARGFRSDALDRHMDVLKAYMLRLNQSGILDEVAMAELPPGANTPWGAKNEFVVTATSLQILGADYTGATGSNSPNKSLVKESSEIISEATPQQSPPRAVEPATRTVFVNVASSKSSNSIQTTLVEASDKSKSTHTTEISRIRNTTSWGCEAQITNTVAGISADKTGTQLNDVGENDQPPHHESSQISRATEMTATRSNRHQKPPIARSQTLNLPVSCTTTMVSAPSPRPAPRLTKSANNTYDPRRYIPQREVTASSDTSKTEKATSIGNLTASEGREASGDRSSETRGSAAAETETNDLGRSYEDAASLYVSSETTSGSQRVIAIPGHDMIGHDQKNERSRPPNPTAESYYSDVESTSSHSTLLRPVQSSTNYTNTTHRRPLNPYVESCHTDDTISRSSHYTERPSRNGRRVIGVSDDFDLGTNMSEDVDDLEPPDGDSVPQNDIDPDSDVRMQRVHAWATGLQSEDANTSTATQPRSLRSHSLDTRTNRNGDDASIVSHNSVATSKTSGPSKIQQAAKAALLAGASQAFRAATEPGKWDQEKGKGVIAAALDAGGIRDEAVRNVVQQFVASITSPSGPVSNEDEEESPPLGESSARRSSIITERGQGPPRASLDRRRTFDLAAEGFGNSPHSRARVIQEYSDDGNSSDEERPTQKAKAKRNLKAGLAVVSTIHAANNVYKSFEKREARRKAIESGLMTQEEARKLKTKAILQDSASIGIATLSIKSALANWKDVSQ